MDVANLDSWAISAQALDRLATSGEITRRQSRDLDLAIHNLDRLLRKRSGKIIRQKYMTDMDEDCGQVCQMGILVAVRTFDPALGSFSTHVHNKLRAAVGDLKHKMKPESRNIQTIAPVQHVSLFTPIGNDSEDFTIADTIEDVQAQAAIHDRLEVGMVYLQIDRAYSHYLARSEGRRTGRLATPSGLREHRINKLREREVFVRHFLQGETLEVIASGYGITRERVRQIAAKIYTDPTEPSKAGKEGPREPGALNRYLATSHVSEEHPTGYNDIWSEYVALSWAEFGRDIRLAPTSQDLSAVETASVSVEFHPADTMGILPEPALDAVEAVIEDMSDEDAIADSRVVPIFAEDDLPLFAATRQAPRRNPFVGRIASAALGIALATSMASAAAAQTSRAIPPDQYETAVSRMHRADAAPKPVRIKAARSTAERSDLAVVDARRIVLPVQAYGVMVASYADVGTMRASWAGVRSGWNMLTGLRPAGIQTAPGKYGLMFGPISREQAFGVCHEAKRRPRECTVTRFGREAEKKQGRDARQVAQKSPAGRDVRS
jgi:hypothetical protein